MHLIEQDAKPQDQCISAGPRFPKISEALRKRWQDPSFRERRIPAMKSKFSTEERFWKKVEKTESCWLWKAATDSHQYGQFWADGIKLPAHRYSYVLTKGTIPNGLVLDHLCRTTLCVNPDHLEAVTQSTNVARGNSGAHHRNKTHCSHGHEFTKSNTREKLCKSTGYLQRTCKMCVKLNARKYYKKRTSPS